MIECKIYSMITIQIRPYLSYVRYIQKYEVTKTSCSPHKGGPSDLETKILQKY